jgi:histone H3/H4
MTEVLVVTSKVKKYIKDQADFNTSASTIEALSKAVQKLCDAAVEKAKSDGRKTVKDRDIEFPSTGTTAETTF